MPCPATPASLDDRSLLVEPAPHSEPRLRVHETLTKRARPRLSEILWDIDWSSILPRTLVDDISVSVVEFDEARAFIEAHYAEIFQTDPNAGWFVEGFTEAKERYLRHAADCFAFRDGDRIVGLTIWNPSDWSTYYVRTAGVLPEYAGKRLLWRFIDILVDELKRFRIDRIEGQTAPANKTVYVCAMRSGFVVTGTTLTERWGALTQITRFIEPDAERIFGDRFCAMSKPTAATANARPRR